jgi:hypothetical protein
MIAMCRGVAVAGNPEDALDVEMRIEAGQLLDCPRDLVDQAKHRLFSLPGIAEQARHESGFGGKFGAQRLACEKGVDQSEAAGGPFWQGHRRGSVLLPGRHKNAVVLRLLWSNSDVKINSIIIC